MGERNRRGIPDLRDHLLTRILPFWERYSVDKDYGGFITHLARDGSITDDSAKYLVMQTRMIYSLATGVSLGGPPQWLNLARQGAGFFLRHFRDPEHDGWFWSVDRQGSPTQADKRAYGHAFAIYGLSEYGRIAKDAQAIASASHTWSLVSERLWDAEHEGVFEACDREWMPTDRGHSMGTHLHILEALLALNDAACANRYWPQICTIADLIAGRMVEPQHRCALEKFHPDWTPNAELSRGLIDYGHNFEAAWLLLRVDQLDPTPAYRETARGFLDYAIRFGLDTTYGGIFSHGPLAAPATVRIKVWWVQTEALVSLLLGFLVFGDERYWDAFRNLISFCMRCLHDPEYGEWYHSTEEDGAPRDTTKGSAWKAAYHITQSCTYAHEYLTRIGKR
jgi:mannobiose 2-epimerase